VSGDGKRLVTGSDGPTAILWDAVTGKKLRTFRGDADRVWHVALSRDGQHVIIAPAEPRGAKVIVWDAVGGKQILVLPGHESQINCLALSGDGNLVLTGADDKTAILWEVDGGKKLHTLLHDSYGVVSVALSRDGTRVATAARDFSATLWDGVSGKRLQTIQANVTKVVLSDDGKRLWTACPDGTTRLWDAATGQERCRLINLEGGKDWLVVTPDGLFDGSPGAWRFVAYRVPGTLKLIDDEATRRRFHRPGLLAQVWKGD
jgi:WD40 repeat protein